MMSPSPASPAVDRQRRQLLGHAAAAIALAPLALATPARAAAGTGATSTAVPLGPAKHVRTDVLDIGYVETGPDDGPVVLLLHGWPYDIHSYAEASPMLAAAGYRVIVPYLRGYGATTFLSAETPRSGQQAATGVDALAMMDALGIETAILAGYDWGARTANVVAALWPERVRAMVSVSGYLIGSVEANRTPLPPRAELAWWYHTNGPGS